MLHKHTNEWIGFREEKGVYVEAGEPSEGPQDEHVLTHLPPRSWCGHCLRERGTSLQNFRSKAEGEQPFPLLLPFEAELSVLTIALKDSASFWTELVSLPPALASSAKSDVISRASTGRRPAAVDCLLR